MKNWKPLTKSEYIIWKCETMDQLIAEFPDYDSETISNYFKAVEDLVKRKIERTGGKFTEF